MLHSPLSTLLLDLDGVIRHFDSEVMALVKQKRSIGFVVAVLTNGTDTVQEEMRHFEIDGQFDAVFSSWDIGHAKPDPKAFQHVCNELNVEPGSVFFTDDSPSKLAGAIEIGMTARPFLGVDQLKSDLDQLFGDF